MVGNCGSMPLLELGVLTFTAEIIGNGFDRITKSDETLLESLLDTPQSVLCVLDGRVNKTGND